MIDFVKKTLSFLWDTLCLPFENLTIPSFMMLLTLFSVLTLIVIDPVSSAYIYFNLNKKDCSDSFKAVNFASSESYKAAIEVLVIITFIYLVKTDAGFIDKFIRLLELLKTAESNTKKTLINSINKKGEKSAT